MKVYLDDIRSPLDDWDVIVRNYESCIEILKTGKVTELSLDHDLGTERTGYDVLCWIEFHVKEENFKTPIIYVHSSNPVAQEKMILTVEKIYDLADMEIVICPICDKEQEEKLSKVDGHYLKCNDCDGLGTIFRKRPVA
jgi:hypothetical protein